MLTSPSHAGQAQAQGEGQEGGGGRGGGGGGRRLNDRIMVICSLCFYFTSRSRLRCAFAVAEKVLPPYPRPSPLVYAALGPLLRLVSLPRACENPKFER